MKFDVVEEYVSLKNALVKEKSELEARLNAIDQALSNGAAGFSSAVRPGTVKRIRNPISLKNAVVKVTSKKALTKQEILTEIHKLGYRFNSSTPVNSLNVVLYGRNPKFKNCNGKFSRG